MKHDDFIEGELKYSDHGRQEHLKYKYYPILGSLCINRKYKEFVPAFKMKESWTGWKWVECQYTRDEIIELIKKR